VAAGARAFAKTHVSDSAAHHFRAALLDVQLRPFTPPGPDLVCPPEASGQLGDELVARVCEEVRELQALVAPKPPQGVLVHGHAGRVINKHAGLIINQLMLVL